MFGVKQKLTDSTLYLLHDMIEYKLQETENLLSQYSNNEPEIINNLNKQIDYYKNELSEFEKDLEIQRSQMFQFSVEELYSMYGQFENRFIEVEFHKLSDSAKKFGRTISGTIIYFKSERENLELIIKSDSVPRTNGLVRFEPTSFNPNVENDIKNELQNNGFMSGDIFQVHPVNMPPLKAFNQEGKKEIPNTIAINITPPKDINPKSIWIGLFKQRLSNGYLLIDEEMNKLCGYSLYFEPKSINAELIKLNAFNEDGSIKKNVRFYELDAKLDEYNLSQNELLEYSNLLNEKVLVRNELIKIELKSSTNKTLEKFAEEYPQIFKELQKLVINFDDEALEFYKTIRPIYWDFKSYLHIYLRHCEELQLEGNNKTKTTFQYSQKEIKRILKIAIEKIHEKINDRLSQSKECRIYGDRSLYFNGNYYAINIDKDGRVAAFHPYE